MKITYESATMQFDIETEGDWLKLTLYKQPDEIQIGQRVRYEAAGVTFVSACQLQITHLFDKDDPTVYILGTESLGGGVPNVHAYRCPNVHAYRCNTVAEALSGGSRLYRGLVTLDKQLMGETNGV